MSLLLVQALPGWTPAAVAEAGGLRLETAGKKNALTLPVQLEQGVSLLPLKAAVEYLGGKTTWHGTTRKVVVKGTSGRSAVLTVGLPKAVIDRNAFVRLPHLLRLKRGRVLISPESLLVVWRAIGTRSPAYDPEQRVFSVGRVPVAASRESAPAARPGQKTRKPLIVIDAGHGGKDPGAIGPSRLKEKVVTLEVSLQLKQFLKKRGFRVILTRKTDKYISLKKRAEIANQAKADLFISVHANASRNRKASGSQVFIYNREASSRHAAEAARLENQDANYLEIIKDDLRQSVHEESSITAGGLISQQLEKMGLEVRRIERAPFYVLAKSHMPSILIETAFISNKIEEQKLRSRRFCRRLAEGIDRALGQYYQEKRSAR